MTTSPRAALPTTAGQAGTPTLAKDVVRLVIAARKVAFDCPPSNHAIRELDEASEAFADRVPWDDEADLASEQVPS